MTLSQKEIARPRRWPPEATGRATLPAGGAPDNLSSSSRADVPRLSWLAGGYPTGPVGHLICMLFPSDGFFHAIQQNPEDDALRLMFADFLEEQGEAQATAHAELIRTQVRLTALATDAPNAAEQAAKLTAHQDELLARWQRVWLGDWGEILHGWTFRRGLVEAIQTDASDFLDHAPEWFSAWPTLTVAKLTEAGHFLPELAASPWLAHLRGLDLSNNGIDAEALVYFMASRFVSLLQGLDLSDNPIGPRGAALLASSRSLEELTELHLARCGLWHEGLLALLGDCARRLRPWRRLDLAGNGLHRLGLVRLADSPLMRTSKHWTWQEIRWGITGRRYWRTRPTRSG